MVTNRLKREFTDLEVKSQNLLDQCMRNRDVQKRFYEGKIKDLEQIYAHVRTTSEIEIKALIKETRSRNDAE